MRGEDGQATVEWVALALAAALALGALAVLAGRPEDRELGVLVAKRIAGAATPGSSPRVTPPASVPRAFTPASVPRASTPASAPRASTPPAVRAFRRLRGVSEVAKRAWIVCLGYRRWRYELEHPSAPNEVLPLRQALAIVNTCFNPYDYLLED